MKVDKVVRILFLPPYFLLAWGQGFEPQLTASKAAVLPLDDPQILLSMLFPNTSLKYTKKR